MTKPAKISAEPGTEMRDAPYRLVPHKPAMKSLRDISTIEPFAWMARIGYAARGIVFLIVGGLALLAAVGIGESPRGMRDALRHMLDQPLGGFLLWIVAGGLTCFAIWRMLQTFFDTERYGRGLYGLTRRAILACSGLFYLALALTSVGITIGARRVSEDRWMRKWTGWLLGQPLGRAFIVVIALGFAVVAIGLAIQALRAAYRHRLDASPLARLVAVALGSFGILTRAAVFLVLGAFLGLAAYDLNAREAIGLTGVLRTIQNQSYGAWQLGVTALGLLAFGLFEIIQAIAREIYAPKLEARANDHPAGAVKSAGVRTPIGINGSAPP